MSTTTSMKILNHIHILVFFPTVTIARAIELKHNATLIAALAFETANFYQKAGQYFGTCDFAMPVSSVFNDVRVRCCFLTC